MVSQPAKRRWSLVASGALVLLFGLGCLNYTNADGLEHHRQQAARYNLPPPSRTIHLMGMASTALGAGLAGFGLARTRKECGTAHTHPHATR